jgi:hypothetical protein
MQQQEEHKRVVFIDKEHAAEAWPAAWPVLEPAFNYQANWSPDEIRDMLVRGTAVLWLCMTPEKIHTAMVTWIDEYKTQKVLVGAFTGGEMEDVHTMAPYIIDYAKYAGCSAIEVNGRRGWVREFRDMGFEEYSTTTRLEL